MINVIKTLNPKPAEDFNQIKPYSSTDIIVKKQKKDGN